MTTKNIYNAKIRWILLAIFLVSLFFAFKCTESRSPDITPVFQTQTSVPQESEPPVGNRNEHQYENTAIYAEAADVRSSIWGYFEWVGYKVIAVEPFNHKDMNFWNSSGLQQWEAEKAYRWCEDMYGVLGFGGITNVQVYLVKAEKNGELQMILVNSYYQETVAKKWIISTMSLMGGTHRLK